MLSKITSASVHGIDAILVTLETDISRGMPGLNVVGLADMTVKEARERIRTAIINSDAEYPKGRITVNMAPAGIRKRGSHYDLGMAIGILASSGQLFDQDLRKYAFIGELSLDGSICKCSGILPMVIAMRNAGVERVIVPYANRQEAALVTGIDILPAENLVQVVSHFNLNEQLAVYNSSEYDMQEMYSCEGGLDFADVKGQEAVKRAITIAVSGGHGILMTGSPATGKTMISERIPSIMPLMTEEDVLEATIIYSVAGLLTENMPCITVRPFRQPHHRITCAGLIGGGGIPMPGEITLADKGVLFLDEVGEFDRNVIDTLRVPLEKKKISIVRHGEKYVFPADFMLVAATNPCKCGYFGDPNHECTCTRKEIKNYRSRLTGPILDRIDMHITLNPIGFDELSRVGGQSSADMREQIERVRQIQRDRYKSAGISLNGQIDDHLSDQYCALDGESADLLSEAYRKLALNPRAVLKIRKLARTIADLEDSSYVLKQHVAEAIQYREA